MYDSVLIFISSLGTMLFACVCVCAKKRTHQLQPHVCMMMYVRLYMYGYVSLCMDGWVYACMRMRVRPPFQDRSLALFFALTVSLLNGNKKEGALYPYTRRDRVIVLRPSFLHRRPHETALIDPFKTQANLHVGIS